ncbi:class I SAM-dependent methyltransferase [Citrobacter freundii]|nr:class I SAM-dependent methyltransferase [Citrobacter freundii]
MRINCIEKLTEEIILNMNYPDFVALMKQDNTPPGAEYTIDYWIKHGDINESSQLLDLACSTGFSSRECFKKKGSTAKGVDISDKAVIVANEKASKLKADRALKYIVADACNLPFEDASFTHVLGGCNFAFIQNRTTALNEVHRCLKNMGVLCTSNFYYRDKIPEEIINDVYNAINFRPEPFWTLEYWCNFYSEKFTLVTEENHEMESQSEDELRNDIYDYVFNRNEFTKKLDKNIQKVIFERFLIIRRPLNAQRNYQGVTLQLWRKK